MKIRVLLQSSDDVIKKSTEMAEYIALEYMPDMVVFIAKSGFLFAKPIADFFNCRLYETKAQRVGDEHKNTVHKFIPRLPMWLLGFALRSKAMYSYNQSNTDRNVLISSMLKNQATNEKKQILLVDDSADTGWTLLKVQTELKKLFPNSEIRIFCYCVVKFSEQRINVDYYCYKDTIVLTATSRYSKEHSTFLENLERFRKES